MPCRASLERPALDHSPLDHSLLDRPTPPVRPSRFARRAGGRASMPGHRCWAVWALVLSGLVGSAHAAPLAPAAATGASVPAKEDGAHRPAGIDWHDGDVDSAFASARREGRPVFVYWGAVWCPPCNQLKATLFNRADFQQRAKLFVPVYIDGDAPGAQQLGTRFKVRGYPTTIVLRPDGSEITRLPGEVDPQRYLDVLGAALKATHSVQALRDEALGKRRALSPDEWRLLAYYSWETDEQQLAGADGAATLVARLAAASPAGALRDRLVLKAMSLRAEEAAKDAPQAIARRAGSARPDAITHATLQRVLGDPDQTDANFDLLVYGADHALRWLGADQTPAQNAALRAAWDRALAGLAERARLSWTDRLAAVDARVSLAKLGDEKAPVPAGLVAAVRAAAVRADREARTPAERQTVISAAADVLANAGLLPESDRMLTDELARSPAPYYFMLGLAANARARGDKALALDWYARAHDAARGPATRLQWGATHVRALIDLAPGDVRAVEQAAVAVLGELEPEPGVFEGRNLAVLQRLGARLTDWGQAPAHAAALDRVRTQWRRLCGALPAGAPQRDVCAATL